VKLGKIMFFKRDAQSPFPENGWAWPDAVFGGMILVSVIGLIYLFTRR
jgi:hypothetical protein